LRWGCCPIPRPPHGLTHNDACNEFRSQASVCRRYHRCPSRIPRSGFAAIVFSWTHMAAPSRSASVCVFVRDARGDADDLALASGVVRQPLAPAVSRDSRHHFEWLRAGRIHGVGCAECLDRLLGSNSVSRRMNKTVVGRRSFAKASTHGIRSEQKRFVS
jgi:hypothetical protein